MPLQGLCWGAYSSPLPASGGCQHPLICHITISLPASKVSEQPLFYICQFSLSLFLIRTSLMAFLSHPHHPEHFEILNLISPAKALLQIREKKIKPWDQDIDASVGRGACQSTTEVEAHWRIKQWQFVSSALTDPPQYPLTWLKWKLAGTKYWASNIEKAAGAKTIALPANEVWGCVESPRGVIIIAHWSWLEDV